MRLPYIDANKPQDVDFVKTTREICEGSTKKEIAAIKIAQKSQGIIGHPYER